MQKIDYIKRKELLYKSTHRGCKEMDILLGNFAKKHLDSLTEEELKQYAEMMEMDDALIYSYLLKGSAPDFIKDAFKKIICSINKIPV